MYIHPCAPQPQALQNWSGHFVSRFYTALFITLRKIKGASLGLKFTEKNIKWANIYNTFHT